MQAGLSHTWSVHQECGPAAIIRENFKLFGSAGWLQSQQFSALLWSSVTSSLETMECRQTGVERREEKRRVERPDIKESSCNYGWKKIVPAPTINNINNTNKDFSIIFYKHLYSILIRGFLFLIGFITMFSNMFSRLYSAR